MRSIYQLFIFSDYREGLIRMNITGKSSSLSDEVLLHLDDMTVTLCPDHFKNSKEASVCNRIVQIPFNVKNEMKLLNISVANYFHYFFLDYYFLIIFKRAFKFYTGYKI